jgi:fatty-acid peroxygenase
MSRCPAPGPAAGSAAGANAVTAEHAAPDRSVGLLRTGYPYLLALRRRWSASTLELRLLGRRTTVLSGPQGARLFYNEAIMQRHGALPRPLQQTLFGNGAVHGLDDDAHKQRKAMFLHLLTPAAARDIAGIAGGLWRAPARSIALDPVGIFGEAVDVHCAAICQWAGVPAGSVDLTLGADLIAMVDGFGSLGARHIRARRARRHVARWARHLIRQVRGGHIEVPTGTPLDVVARYPGADGALLSTSVAGVELINLLRPTVAVAYFVAFAAHAVGIEPQLRQQLAAAGDTELEAFAHELRRVYPFVPMLAARARQPVTYQGHRLPRGRRVLLDVYGMLHDPAQWPDPESFRLDRFAGVEPDPYLFLPQGGGDPETGHRCPGERVAIELIKTAASCLVESPAPDTVAARIPLTRFPTRPLRLHH